MLIEIFVGLNILKNNKVKDLQIATYFLNAQLRLFGESLFINFRSLVAHAKTKTSAFSELCVSCS